MSHCSRRSSIVNLTALDMVQSIRGKEISCREVMESHIEQIEDINPKVNAIVTLDVDKGLKEADAADKAIGRGDDVGLLHGIPVAHKDLVPTKGMRTTFGSPLYSDYVPDYSALIVDRMQSAGAITIGKTNTPDFGAGSQSFNLVFG